MAAEAQALASVETYVSVCILYFSEISPTDSVYLFARYA